MARSPSPLGLLLLALAGCFGAAPRACLGEPAPTKVDPIDTATQEPSGLLCQDSAEAGVSLLQRRALETRLGHGETATSSSPDSGRAAFPASSTSASAPSLAQLPFEDGAVESSSVLGAKPSSSSASFAEGGAAGWWFRVGSRSFRAPPRDAGLSLALSDYCYVRSRHGLPQDLLASRVGGTRSIHVIHAPAGSPVRSALEDPHGRHTCLSLRQGDTVPVTFPVFPLDPNYSNPLSDFGRSLENEVVDDISGADVMALLTELAGLPTPNWPTRSAENASASHVAVEYLQREFESFGLQTCLQPLTWKSRCYEGTANGWKEPTLWKCSGSNKNVIGYIPGSSPSSGSVTVGAHYDSRPFENMTAPGADDNGSGVASLMALARAFAKALKQNNAAPRKSVYFVAFAAEEEGLFGSRAFVGGLRRHRGTSSSDRGAQEQQASVTVLAQEASEIPASCLPGSDWEENAEHQAIIMDMVGWASPQLSELTVNLEAYDWANSVTEELAQASSDHNGDAMQVTHSGRPFGSDHMSWLSTGLPAVLAIHGDDPSYGDVYRYYHSSNDTLANINVKLLGMITKMNAGGLLRLSGVDPQ